MEFSVRNLPGIELVIDEKNKEVSKFMLDNNDAWTLLKQLRTALSGVNGKRSLIKTMVVDEYLRLDSDDKLEIDNYFFLGKGI